LTIVHARDCFEEPEQACIAGVMLNLPGFAADIEKWVKLLYDVPLEVVRFLVGIADGKPPGA
jgi:hypothetical protein